MLKNSPLGHLISVSETKVDIVHQSSGSQPDTPHDLHKVSDDDNNKDSETAIHFSNGDTVKINVLSAGSKEQYQDLVKSIVAKEQAKVGNDLKGFWCKNFQFKL